MKFEKDFFILKKLLHSLIKKGHKISALILFLELLKRLNQNKNIQLSGTQIIYKSFSNIKPLLHVNKIRKSNKVFYLPKLINTEQKINLSLN